MPDKLPRVCLDRDLPVELRTVAAERAIEENPANLPVFRHRPGMGAASSPLSLALVTGKKWQNGRTLRVRFLDGEPAIQEKVKAVALQWCRYANIRFDFGDHPDAEIRIAFERDGSWSYIGTDALVIAKSDPTMNFGWFDATTEDEEIERTVLHELGHALGCLHEHQHPEQGIPWDLDAVVKYYTGPPNRWDQQQIDFNLLKRYDKSQSQFSKFDPDSIMLYPVDNALTTGDFEVGWNRKLSDTDKAFIATAYPFEKKDVPELKIGSPVATAIGAHGEEDLYRLAIPKAGRYTLETTGPTDVVMALLGPGSLTTLAAEDDDSGQARNARITATLKKGEYWVRVRHFDPKSTGTYELTARREE